MSEPEPRFLVPFHPKKVRHYFTDVLIVGGGLAGLRAAIEIEDSQTVLVVTNRTFDESSSQLAQGGIAAAVDPDDLIESHVADTLATGADLCDEAIVQMIVAEAPRHIAQLEEWGAKFDMKEGELDLGREGGHSANRIVHALGDATGKEVMRAVIARLAQSRNVEHWPDTFTLDLITEEDRCVGAIVSHERHGKTIIWAKQTILCTGGVGQLYRETTNPPVATGDGMAMAFRAGAELRDMEFVQFHPTVLYIAGGSRSLISEAVRGEGAWLVDKNGRRFMPDYDSGAELAGRDVVSRAIVAEMAATNHPCVYLDLSHLDADRVRARFPGIAAKCAEFGLDISHDRIPVRPGAHYMIGGVTIDPQGASTLAGLWAAGEVGSSGLHGANRLASNSLLEGLVMGAKAGEGACRAARARADSFRAVPLENPPMAPVTESLDLADIRNSLKSLMWRKAGIRRERAGLTEALADIDRWRRYVLARQFEEPGGWQLQNMLTVARIMVRSAAQREESRGVHFRADFPERDDAHWERHLTFRRLGPN